MRNAARCLHAFGASSCYPDVRIYPGASKPLLRPAKHDPEIHGIDGLGGVEGLPDPESADVVRWFAKDADGEYIRALEGLARAVKQTWNRGDGHKTTIISSGPMTNIALFVAVYPDLLDAVDEFVCAFGDFSNPNALMTLFFSHGRWRWSWKQVCRRRFVSPYIFNNN
jgi:uridine nucleosidase